ncbi:S-adenosyl-L-methionine-dependent methyltransferase [Glonium stellatum]|uniref:S-adenosyl-L-methionine-dependent methyltransferase n=1 Tax=Glonium stellatum TaxID=574774 RepID=A0A8E2JVN6_9PEZI|nr:S-adenosyl-L-methionine-dependent methyltransferase [Glonium stellatum]
MTTQPAAKPQYDAFAADYALMEELPGEVVAANHLYRTVADYPHGLKVLDLACGTGTYAQMLLEHGIAEHVVGVDISSEMVRIGQERETKQRPGSERITFHVADCAADLDHLGLEPDSFDLVMGNWLINYAADREQLVRMWRNIVKYLKPGGRYVGLKTTVDVQDHVKRDPWCGITQEVVGDVADGVKIHLIAHCKPQIEFCGYLLKGNLYEDVPLEVGMGEVVHQTPTEKDLPRTTGLDEAKWKAYLNDPYSVVCTAKKRVE